jgi:hypothetical protein
MSEEAVLVVSRTRWLEHLAATVSKPHEQAKSLLLRTRARTAVPRRRCHGTTTAVKSLPAPLCPAQSREQRLFKPFPRLCPVGRLNYPTNVSRNVPRDKKCLCRRKRSSARSRSTRRSSVAVPFRDTARRGAPSTCAGRRCNTLALSDRSASGHFGQYVNSSPS